MGGFEYTEQMEKAWFVYIVECADGTLYTGVTTDVERRVIEHNDSGKGAAYTSMRRPVTLRHIENAETRSDALRREYAIKQLDRAGKQQLFST